MASVPVSYEEVGVAYVTGVCKSGSGFCGSSFSNVLNAFVPVSYEKSGCVLCGSSSSKEGVASVSVCYRDVGVAYVVLVLGN